MDLAITNGTVVTDGAVFQADVWIQDGRIAGYGHGSAGAARAIDASNCFVLPGVVDPHVHVHVEGDPNLAPVIESLTTASATALIGGTTTVASYIRGVPGRTLEGCIQEEISRGREEGSTDFALNLLCPPDEDAVNATTVGHRHGIKTYKVMLAYRTRGLMRDDAQVMELMQAVASIDGVLLCHPENGLVTEFLERGWRARSAIPAESYLTTSPGALEAEGAVRAATMARITDCPLILVHMSARETVAAAHYIKKHVNPSVTWETQPHYLMLTDDSVRARGALAKVGPPLRQADDVDAIRGAVQTGVLSHISSDHAPRDTALKLRPGLHILDAPHGGTSGTELLLPLMLENMWRSGLVSIERLVELVSTNAAKAYRLFPRKGTIRPGADADVVIVPKEYEPREVAATALHGLSDYSLYEGARCAPPPQYVIRRGHVAVDDGHVADNPGAQYLGVPA
jgi:dihydropyrimidinase